MRIPSEKQVMNAIKAMGKAREALEPLILNDDENDSVMQLRSNLAEYAGYLERATWWRKAKS